MTGMPALETLPLIQSKMICAKALNTSISYKIQGCLQWRTQLACAYRRLMITNRWHWAKCDIHLPLRNAFLIIILHENCHSLAVPKIKTKKENMLCYCDVVDATLHPSDGAAANEGASWDVWNATKPSSSFSSLRSQCGTSAARHSPLTFRHFVLVFDLNWSAGTDKPRFLSLFRRYICPKLLFIFFFVFTMRTI